MTGQVRAMMAPASFAHARDRRCGSVTFIAQQASMRHMSIMPIALFLGGTLAPVLLMLSPLAVMATSDCTDWKPAAKAIKTGKQAPCPRHLLPRM